MLKTLADIARAVTTTDRLAGWEVSVERDDYLELRHGRVVVVLLAPTSWNSSAQLAPHLRRARSGNYSIVLLGETDALAVSGADSLDAPRVAALALPTTVVELCLCLRGEAHATALMLDKANAELELERARHESDLLVSIGRALSQERDIHSLLDLILLRAREVTGADAGSVYVVEGDDDEVAKRQLRFAAAQNDSIEMEFKGFTMPVSSSSIVGACVLGREVINISDIGGLDAPGQGNNSWGFVHDRSFDDKHGYETRSILAVPMISARDQVIGVIQLINKRRGVPSRQDKSQAALVIPFDTVSEKFAATLASQAGIALENALLYDEVKTLFEGFVRASVTAIESRDPTTSGHSERVADLTVELARVADRSDSGSYADLQFSVDEIKQIEWAGLLHDFGKVGVREHVLVKAKKLYPHQRELILQRFQFIRAVRAQQFAQQKIDYLLAGSREQIQSELERVDAEMSAALGELDDYLQFILKCDQPTILEEGGFERIAEIAALRYVDGDGTQQPYLAPHEADALQVLRGSLTSEERKEIESHVVHTYNFLKQIPWGRVYRDVPEIAGAHHEKLDGSGYPNQFGHKGIPIEAKMMTISDIYDALTASDRPYKKAVPVPKALDILGFEVKAGKLDAELYDLFLDAKVYEILA